MKDIIANLLGWVASLAFVAVATLVWGAAALCVWLSGNGTLAERG